MNIRLADLKDLDEIEEIYRHARQFMRLHNNFEQWQNNWPPREVLIEDINKKQLYVNEDNKNLLAVFAYIEAVEPTYLEIEGKWLNDEPYAVIHRIASKGIMKGSASYCIDYAINRYSNIRIDTHKDNYPMQNLLNKMNFKYCGIIHIADGSPRLAYQYKKEAITG